MKHILLLACVLATDVPVSLLHAQTRARPNIVLILADDMGFSDIGVMAERSVPLTSTVLPARGSGSPVFTTTHSARRPALPC